MKRNSGRGSGRPSKSASVDHANDTDDYRYPLSVERGSDDLLNLTLAAPAVNRDQKRARDAADWTSPLTHPRPWTATVVTRVVVPRLVRGMPLERRIAT